MLQKAAGISNTYNLNLLSLPKTEEKHDLTLYGLIHQAVEMWQLISENIFSNCMYKQITRGN